MSKLEDLDFADDIALLSSKFSDLQDKTTSIKEWTEKAGLKINAVKTKTMRLNIKVDRPVKIDGKDLEDVLRIQSYKGERSLRWHQIQAAESQKCLLCAEPGMEIHHLQPED